jgi:hypothetical protein
MEASRSGRFVDALRWSIVPSATMASDKILIFSYDSAFVSISCARGDVFVANIAWKILPMLKGISEIRSKEIAVDLPPRSASSSVLMATGSENAEGFVDSFCERLERFRCASMVTSLVTSRFLLSESQEV